MASWIISFVRERRGTLAILDPMSLLGFQRALSDLAASPRKCHCLRSDSERVLGCYDLSPHEQQRIIRMAEQRGMGTHCGLYRTNRITPIYTLLRLTCFALGDDLGRVASRFWAANENIDVQFTREISRFAEFLRQGIRDRQIENPILEEILDFELATNALRYLPRNQIARELGQATKASRKRSLRVHPLVKVVRFRHDPTVLLRLLNAMSPLPYALAEEEVYVLLDASGEDLLVKRIAPLLGQVLQALERGFPISIAAEHIQTLVEAGIIVHVDEMTWKRICALIQPLKEGKTRPYKSTIFSRGPFRCDAKSHSVTRKITPTRTNAMPPTLQRSKKPICYPSHKRVQSRSLTNEP